MHKKLALAFLVLLVLPLISLPLNLSEATVPVPTMWASSVVDHSQGLRKDGTSVLAERSDPSNALGPPDSGVSGPPVKFFSLGFGGWIILGFPYPIANGPGDDALVVETTWGTYPLESADVRVSQDGTTWVYAGTVDNVNKQGKVPLPDDLAWVSYVKIEDTTNPDIHGSDADGYDLDAVGAYYTVTGTVEKTLSEYEGYLGDVITVTLNVEVATGLTMTVEDVLPSCLGYIPGTFMVGCMSVTPTVSDGVISTTLEGGVYVVKFDVQVVQVEATVVTDTNRVYLKYDTLIVDEDSADITTYPYCGFHKLAFLESTEDGDDIIEVGEIVVWEFRITVTNLFEWTMEDVVVTDRLAAELEVDEVVDVSTGTFSYEKLGAKNKGATALTWEIGDLEPGETATLILEISTGTNPKGKQEYTSPNHYEFNSGATLKFIHPDTGFQLSAHTGPMEFDVPGEWPHFQPYCLRYPETGNAYIGYEDWPNGDFDYNNFGMTFSFEEMYDEDWNLLRVTMTFTAVVYDSGMDHLIHIKRPINGPSVVTVIRPNPIPSKGPTLGRDETPEGTYPFTGDVDVILFNTRKYDWPQKKIGEVVIVEITVVDPTLNPKDLTLVPPREFIINDEPFYDLDPVMANYDPWEEGTLYGSLFHISDVQHVTAVTSGVFPQGLDHRLIGLDLPYILVVPYSDWIPPYEDTCISRPPDQYMTPNDDWDGPYNGFYDYYSTGDPTYANWYATITNDYVGLGGISWAP